MRSVKYTFWQDGEFLVPSDEAIAAIPRHTEINESLAKSIIRKLKRYG